MQFQYFSLSLIMQTHSLAAKIEILHNENLPPDPLGQNEEYRQEVFSAVKNANGHFVCECKPFEDNKRKISVRKLPGSERLILARYPDTGPEHEPSCGFYEFVEESNETADEDDNVIPISRDEIRLDIGLTVRGEIEKSQNVDSDQDQKESKGPSKKYLKRNALGTLYTLWERAGLNHFHPKRLKNWTGMREDIIAAAYDMRWSKRALIDRLVVLVPGMGSQLRTDEIKEAQRICAEAAKTNERIIVITPIKSIVDSVNGHLVNPLAGNVKYPMTFWMNNALNNIIEQQFNLPYRVLCARSEHSEHPMLDADHKARVMAMLVCSVRPHQEGMEIVPGKFFTAIERAALMVTSQELIPVDSSHELLVAKTMTEDSRIYVKPLRYDRKDLVVPDFELVDVEDAPYPLEIFGLQTASYIASKQEKVAQHELARPGQYWVWNPAGELVEDAIMRLPESCLK